MSINDQLQEAYQLVRSGNKPAAVNILLPIVRANQNNADAWWLLANSVNNDEQARRALEQVLRLRPNDERARKMLDKLNAQSFGMGAAPTMTNIPPQQTYSNDPFANKPAQSFNAAPPPDPFSGGTPQYGGGASFGNAPQPGGYYMPPGGPVKQRSGCRSCLIGCLVVVVILALACAGTLIFARSAVVGVLDQVATQNPEQFNQLLTQVPNFGELWEALRSGDMDALQRAGEGMATQFNGQANDFILTATAGFGQFGEDLNSVMLTATAVFEQVGGSAEDLMATANALQSGK